MWEIHFLHVFICAKCVFYNSLSVVSLAGMCVHVGMLRGSWTPYQWLHLWRKITSSLPAAINANNPHLVYDLMCPSASHAKMLKGSIVCRSCAENHSFCEFMCIVAMPYPEESISQHPFLFYILFTPTLWIFPESWGLKEILVFHLGLRSQHSFN